MRFTVQAPDGRRITLEGDRAPTEQELNEIFGYSNKQPQNKPVPTTKESLVAKYGADALAKMEENSKNWNPNEPTARTLGDKIANKMVNSRLGRDTGFFIQGVTNAGLNPFGSVMRAAGVNTEPLGKPQNAEERIYDKIGEYGTDTALFYEMLKNAAAAGIGGNGLWSNVINAMSEGGMPLAGKSALGSAIVTGGLNPQTWWGQLFTDTVGAATGANIGKNIANLPRNLKSAYNAVKNMVTLAPESDAVKNLREIAKLKRNVNIDSLNEAMAEAERTGRSVLEVGDDAVLQAAQRARQQTPEARQIITKNLQDMLEAQKARTRGVIDENLGTQSKAETVADVMEAAKQKAAPLYKELENIGDLAAYEAKDIPEQNFKRWFGDSKVVDENGQPLKLYHGTDANFDAFDMSKGRSTMDIQGAFFSPYDIDAKGYGPNLKEVYLNIKNPADEATAYKALKKYQGQNDAGLKARQDLQRQGFDGVFNGYDEYIAFEPNQIKSVNNSGAWSSSPSLSDAGWVPESKMANLVKDNDVVADAINKVKHSYSSLKNLPDTDAKVLLEARKLLSKQTISNDPTLAYQAKSALSEFDPVFDDITGGKLTKANQIYKEAHKYTEAAEMGRDVFNNRQSVAEFKQNLKKLSANEKDALKIGVRDEMVNRLGSVYNENVANKKFLVDNTRQKLKAVLGDKGGDAVIDEAEQAYKVNQNANIVLSGSQTAEKQGMRDRLQGLRRLFHNPVDTTVDAILSPFDNKNNVRLANALTNPELAKIYNQMRLQQIIAQAKQPQKINWTPYLLAVENYANQ